MGNDWSTCLDSIIEIPMPKISRQEAINRGLTPHEPYLQTILISKERYTLPQARRWLEQHEYKSGVRSTTNFYRFMQQNPVQGGRFFTEKINDYIELVYCVFA